MRVKKLGYLIIFGSLLFLSKQVFSQTTPSIEGTIKKVDVENHKVFIKHNGINEFEMPAMTMGFKYSNHLDAIVPNLQEGQKIKFKIEKKSNFTVVEIEQ